MSIRALGISATCAMAAALTVPLFMRSMVSSYAPPLTEPHVDVSSAFCVVSASKTQAVILEAGTKEVLFELKNGVREGSTLKAAEDDPSKLSVEFDKENRAVKCENNGQVYATVWYARYRFE